MNQKDKVNVMNKTTYRYHVNVMIESALAPNLPFEPACPIGEEPMLACATA